jgi:ABC-2 type transport system permease protein
MNTTHLKAFLWLRWRLTVNQFKRGGGAGMILTAILAALIAGGAVLTLIVGIIVGLFPLKAAPARAVMFVWDGAIAAFVVLWFAGLIAELQRTDAISLDRFLHLPVSPSGAFVINFIGSSLSLAMVLILPAMSGLAIGLVLSRGLGMLVLFPLVAAFFLMMTALAYQFRGWLASLMANPRRRRTVIAVVPAVFFLLVQLPNLWNTMGPDAEARREARRRPAQTRNVEETYGTARLLNMVVPPGWLAYGAESAANGQVWPAWAGVFGMAFIGTISMRRAYGTTLRLYKGDFSRGRRQSVGRALSSGSAASAKAAGPPSKSVGRALLGPPKSMIGARLPWISEGASAVSMATLRSWTRATEMKMALLTPIFMVVIFGRMFTRAGDASELMRPLTTSGMAAFIMIFAMLGPMGNQFGYDRAGFRAFVLSPTPRRDLLLGKNLAALPFALAMMIVVVGLSQWFKPMRIDHFAGVLFQLIPMYLVFCLACNLLSVASPITLKPGSGMPVPHQGVRSFGPLLLMVVSPFAIGLTLMPWAAEALFYYLNWFQWFPAYLVLGAIQGVVIVLLYRWLLDWQGGLLQRRERTILEIVAAKAK